jgi:hypothetical protein
MNKTNIPYADLVSLSRDNYNFNHTYSKNTAPDKLCDTWVSNYVFSIENHELGYYLGEARQTDAIEAVALFFSKGKNNYRFKANENSPIYKIYMKKINDDEKKITVDKITTNGRHNGEFFANYNDDITFNALPPPLWPQPCQSVVEGEDEEGKGGRSRKTKRKTQNAKRKKNRKRKSKNHRR